MKAFRVSKKCDPNVLLDALRLGGIPVVVIRFSTAGDSEPAVYAVIVTEDGASDAMVKKVLAGHKVEGKTSKTPTPSEMEAALKQMEKL